MLTTLDLVVFFFIFPNFFHFSKSGNASTSRNENGDSRSAGQRNTVDNSSSLDDRRSNSRAPSTEPEASSSDPTCPVLECTPKEDRERLRKYIEYEEKIDKQLQRRNEIVPQIGELTKKMDKAEGELRKQKKSFEKMTEDGIAINKRINEAAAVRREQECPGDTKRFLTKFMTAEEMHLCVENKREKDEIFKVVGNPENATMRVEYAYDPPGKSGFLGFLVVCPKC
ncbi:unnamed protein product [Caenorhabditis brenneri]